MVATQQSASKEEHPAGQQSWPGACRHPMQMGVSFLSITVNEEYSARVCLSVCGVGRGFFLREKCWSHQLKAWSCYGVHKHDLGKEPTKGDAKHGPLHSLFIWLSIFHNWNPYYEPLKAPSIARLKCKPDILDLCSIL